MCNDTEQGARDSLQVHPLVGLWVAVLDFQLVHPSSVLSGFTHALSVANHHTPQTEIFQFGMRKISRWQNSVELSA
jgi:hypothetical protein